MNTESIKLGYWEFLNGEGRKRCHDTEPEWWTATAYAKRRAGVGYCARDLTQPDDSALAWSAVHDTYDEAYSFWIARKAEAEAQEALADFDEVEGTDDIEQAIRRAAKSKYGTVLNILSVDGRHFRLAVVDNDPEYPLYPALTISAWVARDGGITFEDADYYLTKHQAERQLDEWLASERDRQAKAGQPARGRKERA